MSIIPVGQQRIILCSSVLLRRLQREADKCLSDDPFTQAIFAAIFLLLIHAIKWIDLRMY